MKLPNQVPLVFLLIIFTTLSFGQNKGVIKGTISDTNGKQLSSLIVHLLQSDGTSIIKTNVTENNGSFIFEELTSSSYFVSVTADGYETFTSNLIEINNENLVVELPKITLKNGEVIQLNEVKIDKKVPFVVQKVDKTIVNPEALISNAGGNALDVLSKSPGVTVDENGNVKLRGKSGVTIFIDDKPTYLTGTELENYLKSLSSNAIKQIEIMTNPPAKYEASGNGGIINIVTKRSKLKGFNGNVSLNFGQGKYARTMDNLNLNYTTSKFALYTNLSYSNAETYHDLTIERRFKNEDGSLDSSFEQNTYLKALRQSYNARIGFDYYLSEKSTLGIVAKGLSNPNKNPRYNYATVKNENGVIQQIVTADNKEDVDFKNGTITLNFRHQFAKPEQLLTVDFDYVAYFSTIDQLYKNAIVDVVGPNSTSDIQNGHLPSKINIYALKSDYTTPLKKDAKLDFGAKVSTTKTNNEAIYTKTTQADGTLPNYDLSNHFFYDEIISAAYVNYTKSFKKIDIQAGLRFEDTQLKGKQLGNPNKPYAEFRNNYNSLFPTAYISYKIDSLATKTINLSYGKRVERPFYKDLNPFSSPLDQFTFYEGNPFLKPTFGHNFSLTYNYTELLSTSFSYSHGRDEIKETIEIIEVTNELNEVRNIYYSRPNNIGKSNQYALSVQSQFKPTKWLTTVVYTEVNYSNYKSQLYDQTLNAKGTYWFINATNSIQFSKKWSGEISGQYLSQSIDAQFTIGDFGFVNVGCQKKILKDLGTLKFNLSDVFFTNQIRGTINNLGTTEANWYGPRDTRIFTVGFSYRFGKNTSNKTKYNGTGSESEQNRVKV
jgi:hypothetical protein